MASTSRYTGYANRMVALPLGVACLLAIAPVRTHAQSVFMFASPQVKNGAAIPRKHSGCDWQFNNISPALRWSGAPPGTKSFVVTVGDPKAVTGMASGNGAFNWIVYNLPDSAASLPEDAGDPSLGLLPGAAVQSRFEFGLDGYWGPCPSPGDGTRRYIFTIYALKVDRIPPFQGLSREFMKTYVEPNVVGRATFTALYSN